MGNVSTRHHRSKGHCDCHRHRHRHRHRDHHHHTKRHHQHRTKKHHKGGQSSPLNPNKKSSSSLLKTRKIKKRDHLSLGDKLLRNKGVHAYSKAKRSEYIENLKRERTEQFRKQKESFLSGNTPSAKRKSI
jgi:hypothetical protein